MKKLAIDVVKAVRAPLPAATVRRWLGAAAADPDIDSRLPAAGRLTLRITGDRELRTLNSAYLGHDAVTDVLSFPAGSPAPAGEWEGGPGEVYLGDLALSWPAVQRQAATGGHSPEEEAALLLVHGLLHLLGWDHLTRREERTMTAVTQRVLAGLDIHPRFPAG